MQTRKKRRGQITKGVKNDIAKRQNFAFRKNTGASQSRIKEEVSKRKPIEEVLKGFSKYDIGRAAPGRLKYRADSSNLIWAKKKEITAIVTCDATQLYWDELD